MAFAGLEARIHTSIDRDGVSALAPRREGVDHHEIIRVEAAVGRERAARARRRSHQQRVAKGTKAFAGGLGGGKAI